LLLADSLRVEGGAGIAEISGQGTSEGEASRSSNGLRINDAVVKLLRQPILAFLRFG
jgi:hypothetical protein